MKSSSGSKARRCASGKTERYPPVLKVLVEPIGVTVEVAAGDTLLAAVSSAAVDLPVDCAGRGTCGKCRVRLGAGELSAPTSVELNKLTPEQRAEGWRLACQAKPLSARVSIEVRETAGRRQILTASKLTHGEAHPAVAQASGDAAAGHVRGRAQRPPAGAGRAGRHRTCRCRCCASCPSTLRDGRFKATTTMYEGRLIDIEPGTST